MHFDTNVIDHYYDYFFNAGFALVALSNLLVLRKFGYDFQKARAAGLGALRDPVLASMCVVTMLVVAFALAYPMASPTFCQNNLCKGHHGHDPKPQAP